MKQQRILPVKTYRAMSLAIAVVVLAVAAAAPMQAQTYSALYEFGGQTRDPTNPQYSGLIAQGRDGNLYSTAPATPLGLCSFCGAVFNITPSGTVTVVYDFNDATGSGYTPFSGLILGIDGNFYGTTKVAGTFGGGTLFKITASGTLTTRYNFGACKYPCKDGLYPIAPPVQGTDGSFYGTTPYTNDGTDSGVVYKLTSAGKFTTIHAFDYTAGGYNPNAPLIQGADGNFYGTTTLGGKTLGSNCVVRSASNSCGTVFKMTPAGKVTFIYEFDKTHGAGPIGPVIQGTNGNFYGTTSEGGTSGFGVVFKLTSAGVLTVLHNFNGTDGKTPDAGLVQANDGNFYGVASAGGTLGYGTIFKVSSTGTFSVVYNFENTHGAAPQVTLFQHTNGILYGDTESGDSHGYGVFYSLNIGAAEFARLQPTSGKVGSSVGIFGQGFTGTKAVSFNGVNATPLSVTDTYLTVTVPSGAKTGTVTVVRPSGKLNSLQQFKVTPTISSFSPSSGKVGTIVTINGTGLTQTTKVTFGVKAATFKFISDSKVTATVPSGATTGKITVTTAGGSATSSGTFTVTP
jgi:uncharacterized repeat protein (TIGR03803 family)